MKPCSQLSPLDLLIYGSRFGTSSLRDTCSMSLKLQKRSPATQEPSSETNTTLASRLQNDQTSGPIVKRHRTSVERAHAVHLLRRGGKVVQDCDVYIGRAMCRGGWRLAASKWANPIQLKNVGYNRQEMLRRYRSYLLSRPDLMSQLHELKGKRLGCWFAFDCLILVVH